MNKIQRMVPAAHRFTISHVHCPAVHVRRFEKEAQKLLPLCRTHEQDAGLVSEHLHRALSPLSSHTYHPARCGFTERNVGREGRVGEEGEIQEYVWFEEWQGVAAAHAGAVDVFRKLQYGIDATPTRKNYVLTVTAMVAGVAGRGDLFLLFFGASHYIC